MTSPQISLSTGIDWLTLSSASATGLSAIQSAYQRLADGNPGSRWQYHGYSGNQVADKSVSWGYNEKQGRALIICRGPIATLFYQSYNGPMSQVSRLDLQCTVSYDEPQPSLLMDAYQASRAVTKKRTVISADDLMGTVYVGSRQSSRMLRIYDAGKHHKTAKPYHIIRYEVEFKKPLSREVYDNLRRSQGGSEELAHQISGVVAAETEANAIRAPWSDGKNLIHFALSATNDKRDKRLVWLRDQVAPAIKTMLAQGYDKKVLMGYLFDGGM
jgi:hypothetical protein